jgi:threonine aldolase
MPMTDAERKSAHRTATRHLHVHGPRDVRRDLAALAEEAPQGERGDMYGKGDLHEAFEKEIAALLGKPAAVFMPSGTMAQQIALRIWSDRRGGAPVAFHPTSHVELHEQRGYAFLHRLRARLVGERHRLIGLADLEALAEPVAALLLELPQREIGGALPAWDELLAQAAWARAHGVALHLDGARLWETQPFYGRPLAEIAAPFDSVYVSFYKILGALAGAALAGPEDFIAEARVWQRRHGGNLVTQVPFVLSARAGLRDRLPRVEAYVARARALARTLAAIPGVRVLPDPPPTNMMHVVLPGDRDSLLDASARIAQDERVSLFTFLRASEVPGVAVAEIAVGEGAMRIEDAEVARWFRRILGADGGEPAGKDDRRAPR